MTLNDLGLGAPDSWMMTLAYALAWLALMLAYSPIADKIATRFLHKTPTLNSFRVIQQSKAKLIGGILVAWILGGFLEELVFRGIVLKWSESYLAALIREPIATGFAICIAALGAGLIHFYQGPRAMAIITQLSVLFGVLFVVSGYNLWTVILCHGFYDTIAFVRFAYKKSKYSQSPESG
jgi:uncharacterized protein